MELRTNPALGPVRVLHSRSSTQRDADGKVVARMGTLQDVTQQRAIEDKLRLSARVFEHTSDGIIVCDADNVMIAVNAACEAITGFSEAELLGQTPRMLHTGLHEEAFFDALWADVRKNGSWRGETWSRRKNGEIYPKWLVFSAIPGKDGAVKSGTPTRNSSSSATTTCSRGCRTAPCWPTACSRRLTRRVPLSARSAFCY